MPRRNILDQASLYNSLNLRLRWPTLQRYRDGEKDSAGDGVLDEEGGEVAGGEKGNERKGGS